MELLNYFENFSPRYLWRVSQSMGLKKTRLVQLVLVNLGGAILESAGLLMLMPVFQYIEARGDVASLIDRHFLWRILDAIFSFLNQPINLATLLLLSFLCICGRQLFFYGRAHLLIVNREMMISQMRLLIFTKYLNAQYDQQEKEPAGVMLNGMTYQLSQAIDGSLTPVTLLNMVIVTMVWLVALIFTTGIYTIMAVAGIALAVLIVRRFFRNSLRGGYVLTRAYADLSEFLVERFKSLRLIRLSRLEVAQLTQMKELSNKVSNTEISLRLAMARLDALLEPLTLGICFLMLYFGFSYLNISFEQVGMFIVVAVIRLLPLSKEIVRSGQAWLGQQGDLSSVLGRVETLKAAAEQGDKGKILTSLGEGIVFKNVSFTHSASNRPALKHLNFSVLSNKMTALVGPSGSGKSTLIDLLPRMRSPQEGKILIAGKILEDYSLSSLRKAIAYVSQHPQLFNITIEDHIRLGKEDATTSEIQWAAKLAGVADFVKDLPQGYQTKIGESGFRLSGGQRQRLDLGRALISKSPCLILDEPTSGLDAVAESVFFDTIARIRTETDTTILIISHRLSTIADADQIIVLNNGEILEKGTHAELLANQGWYAEAFYQQSIQTSGLNLSSLSTV